MSSAILFDTFSYFCTRKTNKNHKNNNKWQQQQISAMDYGFPQWIMYCV